MEAELSGIQVQKQSITPELRQSMQILNMSSQDLYAYIAEQSSGNPFIELQSPKAIERKGKGDGGKRNWHPEAADKAWVSLEETLLHQLAFINPDRATYSLCRWLIGNLDENGYLPKDTERLAVSKGEEPERVKRAVNLLQSLEPWGVGATSLAECLMIQLDRRGEGDALLRSLVQDDLHAIAEGRQKQLADKYNTDITVIQDAVERIRRLEPRPGRMYGKATPPYIQPDLILTCRDGATELAFEERSIPAITLNGIYADMMKRSPSKEVSRYLKHHWKAANWLMQCMDRRKATLLGTASVLFAMQADFCRWGPSFIQPLSMKQVAEALGVHESTISRTVHGKYVRTPWGLFELKRFFPSSVKHANGSAVSGTYAKERIRRIIAEECRGKPFSDQQIAEVLALEGIMLSRRTVAKYREQLRIASSSKRKQH